MGSITQAKGRLKGIPSVRTRHRNSLNFSESCVERAGAGRAVGEGRSPDVTSLAISFSDTWENNCSLQCRNKIVHAGWINLIGLDGAHHDRQSRHAMNQYRQSLFRGFLHSHFAVKPSAHYQLPRWLHCFMDLCTWFIVYFVGGNMGLENCRITEGCKVQMSSEDNVKVLVYWLKAGNVDSALEQNTQFSR